MAMTHSFSCKINGIDIAGEIELRAQGEYRLQAQGDIDLTKVKMKELNDILSMQSAYFAKFPKMTEWELKKLP